MCLLQPCNYFCLCLLQSQPCRCHASNHCKLKESCSPSLNHYPLTHIKFITIYLYLLNHLITFNYGLIYNQLLCVAQLSKCLYKCHLSMAMFLHCKVGFTLDSNIIGFPMKNDNKPNMRVFTINNFGQPSHFFNITPNYVGNHSLPS